MSKRIPTISFSELKNAEAHVVASLKKAASEWGVFYLQDIGLGDLTRDLMDVAHRFFALPDQQKRTIALSEDNGFCGFVGVGDELTNGAVDLKESINFGQEWDVPRHDNGPDYLKLLATIPWPDEAMIPGFKRTLTGYMDAVRNAGHYLAQNLALALDAPRLMEPLHNRSRLIHYTYLEDLPENGIRINSHTDLAMFNLLLINGPGLEARNAGGAWASVAPRPDSFVVILGEMSQVWSGGAFRAGVHRVRQVNRDPRTSMPFFFYPNLHAEMASVDPNTRSRLLGRKVGEVLLDRLQGIYPNLPGYSVAPIR